MQEVTTINELQQFLQANPLAIVYISSPNCSVCTVDKPRTRELAQTLAVPMIEVNAANAPEIRGQFNLFTAPVVLVFLAGREIYRGARIIDFAELSYRLKQAQASLEEP